MREKGPFCRLLAKIFLTVGGLLAAFLLLYTQTTIESPEPWVYRETALFPLVLLFRAVTLAKREPVGLVLLLVSLTLLALGVLFHCLSRRDP